MTKFKDYFGMEIPQVCTELGFVDISWHNDASAHMEHCQDETLQLWVSEFEPDKREFPQQKRFLLVRQNPNDETDQGVTLAEVETETELLFAVTVAIEEN